MSTISLTTTLLAHSMAWALIHSLWQGLLLYGILFLLLRAFPGIISRVKYYLSYGAFTALFVWFAETWANQFVRLKGIAVASSGVAADLPVQMDIVSLKAAPVAVGAPAPGFQLLHIIEQNVPAIMAVYIAGLAFMLLRFVINIYALKALRAYGTSEPERRWNDVINDWSKRFGIARPVKLLLSSRIDVPMMLGALKPVILLPVATINHLTTEQVEAILLHELAHIRRHDYLLNMLQGAGEAVLFFNPFVWLISGIIRRQRENCCDDMVVANTANPLPYAQALAMLEHSRSDERQLALAATGNRDQLLNRIKRIMELKRRNTGYGQFSIVMLIFIALAFVMVVCGYSPSRAQKVKGNASDTTKRKEAFENATAVNGRNGAGNAGETETDGQQNGANDATVTADDTSASLRSKNPGYSEDTAIIRFAMKNGTTVWARLADDPLAGNGIIKALTYGNKGEAINWDELKLQLQQLIASAYQRINAPQLAGAIEAAIDKEIGRQKKFRESYISIIDSIYVTFEMKDGTQYYVNLASNPLHNPKIFKGIRVNQRGKQTDWDELRWDLEKVVTAAYKNSNSPELQKEIEVAIDAEIEEGKVREGSQINRATAHATLLRELNKDGLLDTGSEYIVHYQNDSLYINGSMLPRNISGRYSQYFDKNSSVSITNRTPRTLSLDSLISRSGKDGVINIDGKHPTPYYYKHDTLCLQVKTEPEKEIIQFVKPNNKNSSTTVDNTPPSDKSK